MTHEEKDKRALEFAKAAGANEPETATIMKVSRLVRSGHKFMDLRVRKDGQEYFFEADWLAAFFKMAGESNDT